MRKAYSVKTVVAVVCLALTLFVLSVVPDVAVGNTFFCMTNQATALTSQPLLVLESITNSTIYTNQTSARVAVTNGTSDADVVKVANQTTTNWKLQLVKYADSNIDRLTNCTIWIHDGTASVQIKIVNGGYSQASGNYYDSTGNSTISVTASANATGTSYVYTYLKILRPSTSTYNLYVITFEVN